MPSKQSKANAILAAQQAAEEARRQQLMDALPNDRDGLIAAHRRVIADFDAALRGRTPVTTKAEPSAQLALIEERYDAILDKLHDPAHETLWRPSHKTACDFLNASCAAAPGEVPLWGQAGQFVCELKGVRALVDAAPMFGLINHFNFHAIDRDAPFISETGYRSVFVQHFGIQPGHCVRETALATMEEHLSQRRLHLEDRYALELNTRSRYRWLNHLLPPRPPAPLVQTAFAF